MTRLPSAPDPIAVAFTRLHRAGWSVGDYSLRSGPGGVTHVIYGRGGLGAGGGRGPVTGEQQCSRIFDSHQ